MSDSEDPAHYVVSADLDFSGTTLTLRFDGTAIDGNIKEIIEYGIIYNEETYPIQKVSLDMTHSDGSIYKVMLQTEKGTLAITLPDGKIFKFEFKGDCSQD